MIYSGLILLAKLVVRLFDMVGSAALQMQRSLF